MFTIAEIQLMCSGIRQISVEDMSHFANLNNYSRVDPQIQWLWKVKHSATPLIVKAIGTFTPAEKAKFLQFVTGSSYPPAGGFGMLNPPLTVLHYFFLNLHFKIMRGYNADALPVSHTCFNRLDLPRKLFFLFTINYNKPIPLLILC